MHLIDVPVSAWFHARADTAVTAFMLFISQWHSMSGILLMSAILGVILWRAGQRWWLLSLLLSVPGGLLLNVLVKNIVRRPRPQFEDALLALKTYSFPSGHTAGATVFYGFLTLLLFSRVHRKSRRVAIAMSATGIVLLVGLSRIYLGVHYVTDVAGAIVEGVLWLALCHAGVRALQRRGAGAPG